MHQKILIFSSAYSCASFLPQKPLPLFAEKAVIPDNRCQLAIEHGMREQSYVNREFTQRRRRLHNENGKKAIRLDKHNNKTLHEQNPFLYISLPSLHDYNVKLPNFTFCRGREQKTTFANIWRIKGAEISAIKFEVAQIHFLSDVFVAVAVVVA